MCMSAFHVSYGVYTTYKETASSPCFLLTYKRSCKEREGYFGITMTSMWRLTQKKSVELDCQTAAVTQDSRMAALYLPHQAKSAWQNCEQWNWELLRMTVSFQDISGMQRLSFKNQVDIPILWLRNVEGPRKTRGSMALGTMISIWKEKLFYSCGATCLKDTLNWRVGWGGNHFIY